MTLADATKRIKTHHQASKHMCVMVLEGVRVIMRHKRSKVAYLWDDSLPYMEIDKRFVKQVEQLIATL